MTITLAKKQTISLSKESGSTLEKVTLGLGWDPVKAKGLMSKIFGSNEEIDLDASCIMFNDKKQHVDIVWFRQLNSNCGNVRHSGDNRTGEGDGDDESIVVNLAGLDPSVTSMVFLVNSFTGQNFSKIANAYCRILNANTGQELARINLSDQGNHTGLIMAYLKRNGNDWSFTAVGNVCNGRTVQDLVRESAAVVTA